MEKTLHLLIMYTMLVLSLLLFQKGRKHPPSFMLAIYALVEFITNAIISLNYNTEYAFYQQYPFLHFVYKPMYTLWVPIFYLYFKYCFSPKFKFQTKHFWHFAPFVISLLAFIGVWVIKGNNYIFENLYRNNSDLEIMSNGISILVKIQYLFYNTLMIVLLVGQKRTMTKPGSQVIESTVSFNWLIFIVAGYALGSLGNIISFYFYITHHPNSTFYSSIGLTYFFIFFFIIFYNTITQKPYEASNKRKKEINSSTEAIMQKVNDCVKERELYLNSELSLKYIADELNEKERDISNAINTIQNRNFKDYINSFRIEYACKLLVNDTQKPIFEVMYESGFNTKGAFNLAFKKIMNTTPTLYRKGRGKK